MSVTEETEQHPSVPHFEKNSYAFLDASASGTPEDVWTKVKVLAQHGPQVTVRSESGLSKVLNVNLLTTEMVPANKAIVGDLTELYFMSEACILHNLQERSYIDEPYTFMANVLVAVNPLKVVKDYNEFLGTSKAASLVHPYSVAEQAYQEMSFRAIQALKAMKAASAGEAGVDVEDRISQSVIMSGESGAGKTESSKLILRHILFRAGASEVNGNDLSGKLLESNEILESFGNSGTLRNHNSSRFGKFIQLWFKRDDTSKQYKVARATIQTYLLERSRITMHGVGEYNFHIFYYLLKLSPESRDKLVLNKEKFIKAEEVTKGGSLFTGFSYLDPTDLDTLNEGEGATGAKKKRVFDMEDFDEDNFVGFEIAREHDESNLKKLINALNHFGIDEKFSEVIFEVLAGILHLGNVNFKDVFQMNQNFAGEDCSDYKSGFSPLETAAKLFGVGIEDLKTLLTSRKITVGTDVSIVQLNSSSSAVARDSLARAIYSALFAWILARLSENLIADPNLDVNTTEDSATTPFIGILDIFGFEVFERNSFEQLLINYANEALQETFNKSIFRAELDLYKREGLFRNDEEIDYELLPPDNSVCLKLFQGARAGLAAPPPPGKSATPATKVKKSKVAKMADLGLLRLIDNETWELKSSDEKLNATFHRVFDKNECFGRLHPIDRRDKFVICHYAGMVTYTVHSFIQKNKDSIPKEMVDVLSHSENDAMSSVMHELTAENDRQEEKRMKKLKSKPTRNARPKKKKVSVVSEYNKQINSLIRTLEATRTSFIRCIKPNASLFRGPSNTWFNRAYVANQLRNLSIPQTVKVLSNGFPTRLNYSSLVNDFKHALPIEEVQKWQLSSSSNENVGADQGEGSGQDGNNNNRTFIAALFYAFGIEPEVYKLGFTKAFFRSGQISKLEAVLKASQAWEDGSTDSDGEGSVKKSEVIQKFKGYYIRKKWRIAFAKAYAVSVFQRQLAALRERKERERLERERLEKLRKAKLRRRWRVAITVVVGQVVLLNLYKEVVRKREEEAERQRQLELKLQQEREELERLRIEKLEKVKAEAEAERQEADRLEKERIRREEELAAKEAERAAYLQKLEREKEADEKARQAEELRKKEEEERKKIEDEKKQEEEKEYVAHEEKKKRTLRKMKNRLSAKKSNYYTLSSLQQKAEYLDPFNRLQAVKELTEDEVLSEQQIQLRAEEIVNDLREKREAENERMKNAMLQFARGRGDSFLEEFNKKVERAREKDEENYRRLVQIEAEKLRFKNSINVIRAEDTVSQFAGENGTRISRSTGMETYESKESKGAKVDVSNMKKIVTRNNYRRSQRVARFSNKSMSLMSHHTLASGVESEGSFDWELTGVKNGKEVYVNTASGLTRYKTIRQKNKIGNGVKMTERQDLEGKTSELQPISSTKSSKMKKADFRRRSVVRTAQSIAEEIIESKERAQNTQLPLHEKEKKINKQMETILNDFATSQVDSGLFETEVEDTDAEIASAPEDKKENEEEKKEIMSKMYHSAQRTSWFREAETNARNVLMNALHRKARGKKAANPISSIMPGPGKAGSPKTETKAGRQRTSVRSRFASNLTKALPIFGRKKNLRGKKSSTPGFQQVTDLSPSAIAATPHKPHPPRVPKSTQSTKADVHTEFTVNEFESSTAESEVEKTRTSSVESGTRKKERGRRLGRQRGSADGIRNRRRKSVNRQGLIVQTFVDASDPAHSTMKQFDEIEKLGKTGELSPDEVLQLKRDLAETAQEEEETTFIFSSRRRRPPSFNGRRARSKSEASNVVAVVADAAIVCKNCFQTNYSSNGSLCRWCHAPLKVNLRATVASNATVENPSAVKLTQRTNRDESQDSEYYDSLKWDITTSVNGGMLRMCLLPNETRNILNEDTAKEMTFFTTLCVFSRDEVMKQEGRRKLSMKLFGKGEVDLSLTAQEAINNQTMEPTVSSSKFLEWRVLHVFSDFVQFNKELKKGRYSRFLTSKQREQMTPLVGANDLLQPHNFEFFGTTLKQWFKNLKLALNSDKISKEFFREAGRFWELDLHMDLEDIGEHFFEEEGSDSDDSWISWG